MKRLAFLAVLLVTGAFAADTSFDVSLDSASNLDSVTLEFNDATGAILVATPAQVPASGTTVTVDENATLVRAFDGDTLVFAQAIDSKPTSFNVGRNVARIEGAAATDAHAKAVGMTAPGDNFTILVAEADLIDWDSVAGYDDKPVISWTAQVGDKIIASQTMGLDQIISFTIPETKEWRGAITLKSSLGGHPTGVAELQFTILQDCPHQTKEANLAPVFLLAGLPVCISDEDVQVVSDLGAYLSSQRHALSQFKFATSREAIDAARNEYVQDSRNDLLLQLKTSLLRMQMDDRSYPTWHQIEHMLGGLDSLDGAVDVGFREAQSTQYNLIEASIDAERRQHLATFSVWGAAGILPAIPVIGFVAWRWKQKMVAFGGYRSTYRTLSPAQVGFIVATSILLAALAAALITGAAEALEALANR